MQDVVQTDSTTHRVLWVPREKRLAMISESPPLEFYLPEEALQGQDVPGHVLWSQVGEVELAIALPQLLQVKAVYNAKSEDFASDSTGLIVKKVKRNGYLGFVLKSSRSQELDTSVRVGLEFRQASGEIVRLERIIRLFRPTLRIENAPNEISISESGEPDRKLRLMHEGAGTLFVSVENTSASEVKLTLPEDLVNAFKAFAEDFNSRLSEIRKRFPQYEQFFTTAEQVDFSKRDEALSLISQQVKELDLSPTFVEEIGDAFISALFQSSDLEMAFIRPIADFINSAVAPRVIFTTPFLEIPSEVKDGVLTLRVIARDLMHFETTSATSTVHIKNLSGGAVAIGGLIDWANGERQSR
jgi:hypothetical protein